MSGIYLHIPFCRQACHYCDFHFSTNISRQDDMVAAIAHELQLRADYLHEPVQTIYFGGGTPSLLTYDQLCTLLNAVTQFFSLANEPEITLEANPDDLSEKKLTDFARAGINRLSIGIQSFDAGHLKLLHRIHSAQEAEQCVRMAQALGFSNISIDLIYGIPATDHNIWEADLAKALALGVPHISAYCLTIEPQTVFGNWAKRGKFTPVDEDFAAVQLEMLVQKLGEAGFEQYEVSNFARNGCYSRHNSSYWRNLPYLGVGPGAHSFNLMSRRFNVSNNAKYLKAWAVGEVPYEQEMLSPTDRLNEYLLIGLRTRWGVDLRRLQEEFGFDLPKRHPKLFEAYLREGLALQQGDMLRLTAKGFMLADEITAQLFEDEPA